LCQNEQYFKEICTKTAGDYEQLLVRTSKDKKWAPELNILAMTIILDRPIALGSHYEKRNILPYNTIITYTLTFTTEQQYIKDHIIQDLYLTSLHSKIKNYKLPLLPKLSNLSKIFNESFNLNLFIYTYIFKLNINLKTYLLSLLKNKKVINLVTINHCLLPPLSSPVR
jgi:hypothetical protein